MHLLVKPGVVERAVSSESLRQHRLRRMRPQYFSSSAMSGSRITVSRTQQSSTQRPMKKPNSRSGFSTMARFARKETAVVAVVAREAFPAW